MHRLNCTYSLVGVLLVAALVLTACPAPQPQAPAEADMGPVTLDWNLGTEPPSLDPSLATDTSSVAILNETMLALTELDPDTQDATPELATSWESSEDGTVWTFSLRDDVAWVTYQDGEGRAGDG